jgi:hypothetical protein
MDARKIVSIVEDKEKRLVFIEIRKGDDAVRLTLAEVDKCAYRMQALVEKAHQLQERRRSPMALQRAATKALKNAGLPS